MGDMEIVRQFNSELSTIYETKPPISKAKVASVTRLAVKAIKYYKHVVQSIEKFAQKCRQEYKIPALYVIDSVIRQSRHQFGPDKDVYGPRFAKNIMPTFQQIFKCTPEEQGKVVKVLNLWQKSGIYSPEVIQPLLNMPATLNEVADVQAQNIEPEQVDIIVQPENQPAANSSNDFASLLEEQRLEHLQQIQQLQKQLQEQQRINEQQQQQLLQRHFVPSQLEVPSQPAAFQGQPQPQTTLEPTASTVQPLGNSIPEPSVDQQQPRFQLQPEVFAQIQALTGMNIRLPHPASDQSTSSTEGDLSTFQPVGGPGGHDPNEIPGFPGGSGQVPKASVPQWPPQGMVPGGVPPHQMVHPQGIERKSSVIDDFDYGDDDDDASRIAEQRRHLMEEEQRLSQDNLPPLADEQGEFQSKFRPIGEPHDRHPEPAGAGPFGRRSPDRHPMERSPGGYRRRPQSPMRRSRSPRWRDRSPRRRSRSPSGRDRDRDKDRGRNRDRDRDWHRDRDHDRDRDRERDRGDRDRDRDRSERDRDKGRGSDRETEKRKEWIPIPVKETLSVCSTTIWVGHLAKTVMKENLTEMFEDQGQVLSVDMVPPRGCAYVVMSSRQDASRALVNLRNARLHSNVVKLAWAPGKGVKGREYKEYFNTNLGVTYIPWDKLGNNTDFQSLAEGGWIDPETVPPSQENNLKEAGSEVSSGDSVSAKEDKDLGNMSQEDLMKLAAAQANAEDNVAEQGPPVTQLSQPPPHIPPPGPMFPGPHPVIPPPFMQPPFPGGPLPPNMIPPGGPPPNLAGPTLQQFIPPSAPPGGAPNGPHGPYHHHFARTQEGGQFPPQSGRSQDTARFPPPGRPDGGQFPPQHLLGPPPDGGQFPPQQPGAPHEGGQFPPHHPGRLHDGQFPPLHPGGPPFHQRPPHHFPPFHPGRPRFAHDIPPMMNSGRPPRGPEFRPRGLGPWGPGPGPMRGPPLRGMPPPSWLENRPPEDPDSTGSFTELQNLEDDNNFNAREEREVFERPQDEWEYGRRRWLDEQEYFIERGHDRNRDRDDRVRERDREDRFREQERNRERDQDKGHDRSRVDQEDIRRESDEQRLNKDVNGEGQKRKSRFEPLEENPNLTEEMGEGEQSASDIKDERANTIAPTIPQNSENELASREEGEILDENSSETANVPEDDKNMSCDQTNTDDSSKLSNPEIKVDDEIPSVCS